MGLEVASASTTGEVKINMNLEEFVKSMSQGIKANPRFLDAPGFHYEAVPDSNVVLASTPAKARSSSNDKSSLRE